MDAHHRDPRVVLTRLLLWGGVLLCLAAFLVLAVRFGAGLLVPVLVLLVLAGFAARIAALGGAGWARQLGAQLDGVTSRWLPSAPQPGLEADAPLVDGTPELQPDSTPRRNGFNTEWAARMRERMLAASRAGSGALSLKQWLWLCGALLAVALPLAVRLYRLDDLQAEMYGDVTIVHEYVLEIRNGNWPFGFILSSGPLYHYLILPVIALFGTGYFGIKMASVLSSVLILAGLFLTARRLIGSAFGLLTVFIAGVSSWLLVFSRLGNSQILVPLLVAASLWLMLRFLQTGQLRDIALCAGVAALGLYGYPQSFVLAPVMFATLIVLRLVGHSISFRAFGVYLLVTAVLAVPFLTQLNGLSLGRGEYLGGKIIGSENPIGGLAVNMLRALLGFHVLGDEVFRSNPTGLPALDLISGVFMIAGVVYWLRRERWRWSPLLLVPLVLLQLPSAMVVNFPNEVPSASRALGSAPVAYLLVASGVWMIGTLLRARSTSPWAAPAVITTLLALVFGLNAQRYFGDYIGGLPYDNTPIGRHIRNYIDTLPDGTNVFLNMCCWQNSMPEPKSIQYDITRPRQVTELLAGSLTCDTVDALIQPPAVLIWDHKSPVPDPGLIACMDRLPGQLYVSPEGKPMFYAATLRNNGLAITSAPIQPGTLGLDPLGSPIAPPPGDSPPGADNAADLAASPDAAAPGVLVYDELQSSEVNLSDRSVIMNVSALDMGEPKDAVDGDATTLMRGRNANPFVIDMAFLEPKPLRKAYLRLSKMDAAVIYATMRFDDGNVITVDFPLTSVDPNQLITLDLTDGEAVMTDLRLEIVDRRAPPGDGYHVHVYEIGVD
jgi:hypothetical protein